VCGIRPGGHELDAAWGKKLCVKGKAEGEVGRVGVDGEERNL